MTMDQAIEVAKEGNFHLVITDSIHIVGKHGSIILSQNPPPAHRVKENRTVYVTVTKHIPDMVDISDLPNLYGENYDRKIKELKIGYELESTIVGSIYDKGPERHIMQVIFNGDTIINKTQRERNIMIPRGSELQFVVSKSTGGRVSLPDLRCQTYDAAKFLLSSYSLTLGESEADATVEDFGSAYVYRQEPAYEPGKNVTMGSTIVLYLTQDRPSDCP